MNQRADDLRIVDVYYADCDHEAEDGPHWSTTRSRDQIRDERSTNRLIGKLTDLRRRRLTQYTFGDDVIPIDHPRSASVRQVLEEIRTLPQTAHSLEDLKELGDVLAKKYLATKYSRTRFFVAARVRDGNHSRIMLLAAELEPDSVSENVDPVSLDLTTTDIPNRLGSWKKGAIYPALGDAADPQAGLSLYEQQPTLYYPHSLECVPNRSPKQEAASLLGVIGTVCSPSPNQLRQILGHAREAPDDALNSGGLIQAITDSGVAVDPGAVRAAWRREFRTSQYIVSSSVLGRDVVRCSMKLDELELRFPLSYYGDKIIVREEGGLHYLEAHGAVLGALKVGGKGIQFSGAD